MLQFLFLPFSLGFKLLACNDNESAFGAAVVSSCRHGWVHGAGLALALMLVLPARASAQYAYVTNGVDGTVSVIDTASNTATGSISVGSRPAGVAATDDGLRFTSRTRIQTPFP
jgi:YVTN family beta-propeller protein